MRQARSGPRRRLLTSGAFTAALLTLGLVSPYAAQAVDIRSQQWYLDPMQASQMWQVSTGKGIIVAVVDSGVNAQQAELRGKVLPGKDMRFGGPADRDKDGHGTTMAMLIAGDGLNGQGVQGLAPGATILPVDNESQGLLPAGIRYAADHGAKVINVSQEANVGLLGSSDVDELNSAVKYAVQHGALVIAATGNDGKKAELPGYPAISPGAVGIAAVDQKGKIADFSNHGPHVTLAAPGVSIPGHCSYRLGSNKGYCIGDGTSEATAIASASAALIWAAHPTWTNNQVLRVMIDTAGKPKGKLPSVYVGYGSVRPRVALLDGPVDPGPADVNPLYPNLLTPPASTTPSPTTSAGATPSQSAAAGHPGNGTSGNGALWTGVGVGVVVVVAGVTGWAVVRRKRARVQAVQPPPPANYPPPWPPQQPNPYTNPPGYGPPPGQDRDGR